MQPEPTLEELRGLVADFQPGRGHVMPALHRVQDRYGYISRAAIEVVARQLNTTPALVYGTVSFYDDFRTHPRPETEIAWCSGPACRLRGGDRIREAIQQTLELPLGGESEDHRYGLHVGQCNGTCSEAPQVWVNGEVVGNLSVSAAIRLAREVKGE
ncbi:MAG: NAD(P)H-dependent oxidoreductase subunit E [Chloroflexi bacterium]|nr:NAD(P)H-dependent oxidoreductase subunit E [Chloroflexota bacterium]